MVEEDALGTLVALGGVLTWEDGMPHKREDIPPEQRQPKFAWTARLGHYPLDHGYFI